MNANADNFKLKKKSNKFTFHKLMKKLTYKPYSDIKLKKLFLSFSTKFSTTQFPVYIPNQSTVNIDEKKNLYVYNLKNHLFNAQFLKCQKKYFLNNELEHFNLLAQYVVSEQLVDPLIEWSSQRLLELQNIYLTIDKPKTNSKIHIPRSIFFKQKKTQYDHCGISSIVILEFLYLSYEALNSLIYNDFTNFCSSSESRLYCSFMASKIAVTLAFKSDLLNSKMQFDKILLQIIQQQYIDLKQELNQRCAGISEQSLMCPKLYLLVIAHLYTILKQLNNRYVEALAIAELLCFWLKISYKSLLQIEYLYQNIVSFRNQIRAT